MYRLFIEKTGNSYVRISLQRKDKRWKTQEREYCDSSNISKLKSIIEGYAYAFKIEPQNIIDTRFDYKGVSWARAILNEFKLFFEFKIWKMRFKNLRKQIIFLHKQSGGSQKTRRKYWIMTDAIGDPMLMTSAIKDTYKRKGWYKKEVDFMALNKECLWSTDNIYA